MSLSLTPEIERAIQEKIDSGRYRSADEVIREGLRREQVTFARTNVLIKP